MRSVESISEFLTLGRDGMKALQIDIAILSDKLDQEKKSRT